ncbi:MAG: hypothetical protein ACRELY_04540 [Polyangiaceae bacterium]
MLAARALSRLGSLVGFSAALFSMLTVACTAGTSSTNCALNTCTSGAELKTFANITRDQMQIATISACIDNTCVTGTPTSVPSSPGDRLTVSLQGQLNVTGYIGSPDPQKGYIVEADFNLSDSAPASTDTYQLFVTTSDGTKVSGGIDEAANFTKTTPNGPDCPPVCLNALIDKTQ